LQDLIHLIECLCIELKSVLSPTIILPSLC
jgi:hypothetical protein